METGEIIGAEALTRWIDKDGSSFRPPPLSPLSKKAVLW